MRPFVFLLRVYSVALHLTLSCFLLAMAAITAHAHLNIVFYPIPFSAMIARQGALKLGAIGLICALLALTRYFKFAFVIWTAIVVYLLLHSLVVDNEDYQKLSYWIVAAAGLAFLGAAWGFKMQRRRALL